ncbi:UMP kinase [Spiroplasma endosymbiont of Aspidapion aeneum]|uniref:UMP kinase n=1 Tax=Spiroplasma endosymbiont of Aspidapion aeneum TaxID=3066276 RepID=UPI00313BF66B
MSLKFKRVLLKISGEALGCDDDIIDPKKITDVARQVIELAKSGLEIGIVIGGGNIWRGTYAENDYIDKITADQMGIFATIMNCLAFEGVLKKLGYKNVKVYSSLKVETITNSYNYNYAREKLSEGYIVLFGGGTGYSYFTTDTAAALRAIEIDANALLMAKNGTKGVYDKDPNLFKDAKMYNKLKYGDLVSKNLQVMDQTAATLAKDANLEIYVFDINEKDNIIKMANGKLEYTLISNK